MSTNATTSGSAGSQATSALCRILTGTAVSALIRGAYIAARSGTAGGGQMRLITAGTALSSMGTGFTPNKRNPNFPAATSSAATATTHSNTTNIRVSVGSAQTGGMGGWVAIEPDATITLLAAGGANGNFEASTVFNAASVAVDFTIEFAEQ